MNCKKNKFFEIKLIQNTKIFFFKQDIFISGPRGLIVYKKLENYQNFKFILSKTTLCFYKNFDNFNKIKVNNSLKLYNLLQILITNVHYFYSKKLLLVGVGIRAWVKHLEKEQKYVLLIKIGFSKDLYIEIPKTLIVFLLRPTLILIRGLNKDLVCLFSSFIKNLKKPDVYKGKGIQYKNESIFLKPGKKS